ncbi:hypothetical protein JZ751_027647, partial [Albula glossodonta]
MMHCFRVRRKGGSGYVHAPPPFRSSFIVGGNPHSKSIKNVSSYMHPDFTLWTPNPLTPAETLGLPHGLALSPVCQKKCALPSASPWLKYAVSLSNGAVSHHVPIINLQKFLSSISRIEGILKNITQLSLNYTEHLPTSPLNYVPHTHTHTSSSYSRTVLGYSNYVVKPNRVCEIQSKDEIHYEQKAKYKTEGLMGKNETLAGWERHIPISSSR